tara:strand:- start:215 stop:364 length:150 start_codon:yes stop_codon:yes gene_type:complete
VVLLKFDNISNLDNEIIEVESNKNDIKPKKTHKYIEKIVLFSTKGMKDK